MIAKDIDNSARGSDKSYSWYCALWFKIYNSVSDSSDELKPICPGSARTAPKAQKVGSLLRVQRNEKVKRRVLLAEERGRMQDLNCQP